MSEILLIKKDKKLSKAQESFNRLIKRIEIKTRQIEALEINLKKYFTKRKSELTPLLGTRMNWQVKYVLFLDEAFEKNKFSKKEKDSLAQMIINLSLPYEEDEQQNPELQRIASKYNKFQFAQLDKGSLEMTKPFISQMMKEEFGIDIDLSDTDEFDFETLQKNFASKMEEARKAQINNDSAKRKNKHIGGTTARSKALAEQLNKSWKKIYLSLVKKLHPDTEMDESLKAGKDTALKEVTAAYEANNFYKLLELQIRHLENTDLLHTEDNTVLNEYLKILKKQDSDLMEKLNGIQYLMFNRQLAFSDKGDADPHITMHIKREKKMIEKEIEVIKSEIATFSNIERLKKELYSINSMDLRNNSFDEDDLFFYK